MTPTASHLAAVLLLLGTAAHAQQLEFLPEAAPPGAPPAGDQVKYTLLKPEDKTFESVKSGERNPFGKSESEMRTQSQKGTNEENQLRDRLEKLRVVGVSPGPSGLRVMLGDMILEPGKVVPQLLPEQTLALRVGKITPTAIELVWIEKKPTGLPARTLTIAVDLRPYVRYQLMGQPTDKNQWEKTGVDEVKTSVGRVFPEVSQSVAASAPLIAENAAVPRAIPVEEGLPAGTTPVSLPGAEAPTIKPNPQWEQALGLLEKLLPRPEQEARK